MAATTLQSLADIPRWMAWRATPDKDDPAKIRKCPFNPNTDPREERLARTSDATTWSTREAAERCSLALPGVPGMPLAKRGTSIVLGDHFGTAIGGIDLDDCFVDEQHTKLAPWAKDVLEEFESYSEISPSGTGIKIFFTYDPVIAPHVQTWMRKLKKIPVNDSEIINGYQWRWGKLHSTDHAPAIEFYITGQFFTVTDAHYEPSPPDLQSVGLDSLKHLFDFLGPMFERTAPQERRITARGRDQTPSGETFRFIKREREAGRITTLEQAQQILLTYDGVPGDWIRNKNPRAQARHLGYIWRKTTPDPNRPRVNHDEKQPAFLRGVTMLRTLAPWRNIFGYNEFASRPYVLNPIPGVTSERDEAPHPVQDIDALDVKIWLQNEGIHRGCDAKEVITVIAHDNRYHPVKEYLSGLEWDRTPRLDTWLIEHAGAKDTPYVRAVSARWRIAAVARIMEPGTHLKWVMVLEGEQNLGKSLIYRATAVKPEWFLDHVSPLDKKDALEELQGKWIVEFAEWDALSRADASRVKAFLSSAVDHFRPSYGHYAMDYPRQWIGGGSINLQTYLTDPTGNMRFCPVACGETWDDEGRIVDIAPLRAVTDQLWAEAVVRYQAGEPLWLDTMELRDQQKEETSQREAGDLLDENVLQYLNRDVKWTTGPMIARELGIDPARWDRQLQTRLGHMMIRFGWKRYRAQYKSTSPNGDITHFYFPPHVKDKLSYSKKMHEEYEREKQRAGEERVIPFRRTNEQEK